VGLKKAAVMGLVGLTLAAKPLAAADGVLIVQKTTVGDTTRTAQVQIAQHRMRAENSGPNGAGRQVVVFDGQKSVLWIINDEKKTYAEITRPDVDRLGAQVNDMMAQMRQQMANMPPEQRAQVEAMMRGRGLPIGPPPTKVEYRKTGTDTVGKWACDKYEGYQDSLKTVEVCAVGPEALGLTSADLEILRELSGFLSKVLPPGQQDLFPFAKTDEQGFSGVPVRRVSFGPRPSTSEVTSAGRQSFPESAFVVPAGYEKTPLPMGPGRGRQ
jgi:hypothetical protein